MRSRWEHKGEEYTIVYQKRACDGHAIKNNVIGHLGAQHSTLSVVCLLARFAGVLLQGLNLRGGLLIPTPCKRHSGSLGRFLGRFVLWVF